MGTRSDVAFDAFDRKRRHTPSKPRGESRSESITRYFVSGKKKKAPLRREVDVQIQQEDDIPADIDEDDAVPIDRDDDKDITSSSSIRVLSRGWNMIDDVETSSSSPFQSDSFFETIWDEPSSPLIDEMKTPPPPRKRRRHHTQIPSKRPLPGSSGRPRNDLIYTKRNPVVNDSGTVCGQKVENVGSRLDDIMKEVEKSTKHSIATEPPKHIQITPPPPHIDVVSPLQQQQQQGPVHVNTTTNNTTQMQLQILLDQKRDVDQKRDGAVAMCDFARRFDAIVSQPGNVCIDTSRHDYLSWMTGMRRIEEMIVDTIVKPMAACTMYERTYGKIGSLNFAIYGRNGSGKRTAVKTICSEIGVSVWVIRPGVYMHGDINAIIRLACDHRPSVILFDEVERLVRTEHFNEEFASQILAVRDLRVSWTRIWLGFLAESRETAESAAPWMKEMCGDRTAEVECMTGEEATTLLMQRVFPKACMTVSPPLTTDQVERLETAAFGCTPEDLRSFAARVAFRALSRRSIGVLSQLAGTEKVVTPCSTIHRPAFERASSSVVVGRSASTPATTCEEDIPAVDPSGCPYVNWAADAEPLYERIDAVDMYNGIVSYRIPRCTTSGEGGYCV